MAFLKFGDSFLKFGGNFLTFGTEAVAPVEDVHRSGGWLPIVYVDAKGRPVGLKRAIERAVEDAPEAEQDAIEAIAERVQSVDPDRVSGSVLAALLDDMRRLAELVRAIDERLSLELIRMARAHWQRQMDDEAAALLLLLSA